MDKIINRFKYYLGGFLIGSIFVFFFFQNRGCSWLPSNRVKNTLMGKVIALPEAEKQELKAQGLTEDDFISFLNDGEIDFGGSLKDQDVYPKVYLINKEFNGKNVRAQFSLYEDAYITVGEILKDGEDIHRVENYTGWGDFIKFPMDTNMVYMDTALNNCLLEAFAYQKYDSIQADMLNTTRINFDQSNLMLPKAEQQLQFTDRKLGVVDAKTIWYLSKIFINKIEFEGREEYPCGLK
ncbi:DUF4258 domain-containing protein [Lishizhenia tianjinensis]|nr:DUF4258 domain-containing protein [Lishizhenia tianjinensis]